MHKPCIRGWERHGNLLARQLSPRGEARMRASLHRGKETGVARLVRSTKLGWTPYSVAGMHTFNNCASACQHARETTTTKTLQQTADCTVLHACSTGIALFSATCYNLCWNLYTPAQASRCQSLCRRPGWSAADPPRPPFVGLQSERVHIRTVHCQFCKTSSNGWLPAHTLSTWPPRSCLGHLPKACNDQEARFSVPHIE